MELHSHILQTPSNILLVF